MGGGSSSINIIKRTRSDDQSPSEDELIQFLMPMYYTAEPLSTEERTAAAKSWDLILYDQCHCINNAGVQGTTAADVLHDVFFQRLFLVHPICQELFKIPMKMDLVPTITAVLSLLDRPDGLERALKGMIHAHNKIGVKAAECKPPAPAPRPCPALLTLSTTDGIVGECIMFAIHWCIGSECFTDTTNRAWCKILSKMMDVIIPEVVHFELDSTMPKRTVGRCAMPTGSSSGMGCPHT